jgi:uncharacterized protein YjbI with pentapeptide repeats
MPGKDKKRQSRSELAIFDATGRVVHHARVADPAAGLRGADLTGLCAPLGQLQGLDLTGATLYWASLGDADLSFANLSDADLRGAMLYRTVCRGTKLCRANLGRDNLNGRTDLKGADLSTADLTNAILKDAVYDHDTKFPPGFDPGAAGMTHVQDLPAGDPARL